jgi:hypothetical protein
MATQPTDFGDVVYPAALVNVTNVCNLDCSHCFVFRASNPNSPRDKMDDARIYVPTQRDTSGLAWDDLRERDEVIDRVIALKGRYPGVIKANVGTLELMRSDVCLESTGEHGENCSLRRMLPLYMGEGGRFERTFCCYGNDVDCSRCGAYGVFNSRYQRLRGEPDPPPAA